MVDVNKGSYSKYPTEGGGRGSPRCPSSGRVKHWASVNSSGYPQDGPVPKPQKTLNIYCDLLIPASNRRDDPKTFTCAMERRVRHSRNLLLPPGSTSCMSVSRFQWGPAAAPPPLHTDQV